MAQSYGPPLVIRSKVALLGEPKVGKTAIREVVCGNQFPRSYNITMDLDVSVKTVPIPDKNVVIELHLHDYAGSEKSRITDCSNYLFVYDVGNAESFEALPTWIELVQDAVQTNQLNPEHIGFLLLGNKSDLPVRRAVSIDEARDFASEKLQPTTSATVDAFEISAQDGTAQNLLTNSGGAASSFLFAATNDTSTMTTLMNDNNFGGGGDNMMNTLNNNLSGSFGCNNLSTVFEFVANEVLRKYEQRIQSLMSGL